MTFMLVPEESTRLAQLQTGEADVIAISRERVPEVKAAGFNVFHQVERSGRRGLHAAAMGPGPRGG